MLPADWRSPLEVGIYPILNVEASGGTEARGTDLVALFLDHQKQVKVFKKVSHFLLNFQELHPVFCRFC